MCLATKGIFMFIINEKLNKQVDGIIMRNPLGPISANFFFGHLQKKIPVVCYQKFIYMY